MPWCITDIKDDRSAAIERQRWDRLIYLDWDRGSCCSVAEIYYKYRRSVGQESGARRGLCKPWKGCLKSRLHFPSLNYLNRVLCPILRISDFRVPPCTLNNVQIPSVPRIASSDHFQLSTALTKFRPRCGTPPFPFVLPFQPLVHTPLDRRLDRPTVPIGPAPVAPRECPSTLAPTEPNEVLGGVERVCLPEACEEDGEEQGREPEGRQEHGGRGRGGG